MGDTDLSNVPQEFLKKAYDAAMEAMKKHDEERRKYYDNLRREEYWHIEASGPTPRQKLQWLIYGVLSGAGGIVDEKVLVKNIIENMGLKQITEKNIKDALKELESNGFISQAEAGLWYPMPWYSLLSKEELEEFERLEL